MDMVTVDRNQERQEPEYRSEAGDIYDACLAHPAVAMLDQFNFHFASRPLTKNELRLFFSSLAAFNHNTTGGIAILAGRLSDQILPYRPSDGHEIGAFVLDAAVDEYGLRGGSTHLELARRFARYLGIAASDIESAENACVRAVELGDLLYSWYREVPIAFALGVHTASEVTSVREFASWHESFLKHPCYGLEEDSAELEYIRVHCIHEPDHVDSARTCVSRYLDVLPTQGNLLREGAETYLKLYEDMFRELDTVIFG